MDNFLASHDQIGFYYCPECNYYVQEEEYNKMIQICHGCKKRIMEVAEDESGEL